jgi:hypothetical protein
VAIPHPEFHGGGRTMPFCLQVDQFTGRKVWKKCVSKYRLGYFFFWFLTFQSQFVIPLVNSHCSGVNPKVNGHDVCELQNMQTSY